MTWLKYLFLSIEGRLARKWWWLAGLIVLVFMAPFHIIAWFMGVGDPDGQGIGFGTYLEHSQAPSLIISLVLLYPMIALYTKRLHDLNHSGKWSLALMAPGYVFSIADLLGLTGGFENPNTLGIVLITIMMTVALGATIYLGFVRGTKGDNQYGPDTLPASAYEMVQQQGWWSVMFGIGGRIPRSQFWIGLASAIGIFLVFMAIVGVLLAFIILPLFEGLDVDNMTNQQWEAVFTNEAALLPLGFSIILYAIASLLFLYNLFAIFVKRLHDRNRSALWLLALAVIVVVAATLMSYSVFSPLVLAIIAVPIAIHLFVEAAMLKGTPDSNRFGPDPLGTDPAQNS